MLRKYVELGTVTYSPGQKIIYYSLVAFPSTLGWDWSYLITTIQKLGLSFATAIFTVKRDIAHLS